MKDEQFRRIDKTIRLLAGIIAAIMTTALPVVYYSLARSTYFSALETEAEINGRLVMRVINTNPELWQFEEERLSELLSRRPGNGIPEARRIVDGSGKPVAESVDELPPPILSRSNVLFDSGQAVGRIEVSRSLRPVLWRTLLIAVPGAMLGLGIFVILCVLPMRTLRKAIESLYEEKERAQVTLQSVGDGVITTDLEGRVVMMNRVAQRITGWSSEEAEGKPLPEVFHIIHSGTRERMENPVEMVLRTGEIVELANQTLLISRDGSERIIADSGAPIRDRAGRTIGVVLVFRDDTERVRVREELQKVAKLESIGVLAGGIAHDFNNILTTIMGTLSLVQARMDRDAPERSSLDTALSACSRARGLTGQFLAFSRGGAPVRQAATLPEILRESAEFALTGANVQVEFHLDGDLSPVQIDSGQISQVVQNLVLNAAQAMPGGGMLRVRAGNATISEPTPDLSPGRYVRISVEDRGCGIPPENLARIFDPYFTTKKSGNGLGLAVSFYIAKNHGGGITVESSIGIGTTVHLYLPASVDAPVEERESEADSVSGDGHGRVLVMDDEKAIRTLLGEMLQWLGYEVETSDDGEEMLERYRRSMGEGGRRFDAVILDLTIPGGMGGKEAIRSLLDMDPDARAIVSSGYSNDPVMAEYSEYGFSGFVAKPYRLEDLRQVLNRVIRRS